MKVAAIFGGAGFIGSHFSQYLLDKNIVDQVIAVDIVELDVARTTAAYRDYVAAGKVQYKNIDVREPIDLTIDDSVTLVANFAAVHREPGHEPHEYYTTNLLGAQNVCDWAKSVSCNNVIFTSSIAPYGPSETRRDESSIPVPETAYGGSKLASEHIHRTWQAEDRANRRLVIVRPGVVFGAGEGGNVTRLIKATIGRYFLYMANKNTRKAGTYVKELCNAMYWALTEKASNEPVLFNMSMNPGPTIKEYVDMVCEVEGIKRFVPNVPFGMIYSASFVVDFISKMVRVNQPISPVRIKKLVRSNNIIPQYLQDNGYSYLYTFKEAMADWRKDKPADWNKK